MIPFGYTAACVPPADLPFTAAPRLPAQFGNPRPSSRRTMATDACADHNIMVLLSKGVAICKPQASGQRHHSRSLENLPHEKTHGASYFKGALISVRALPLVDPLVTRELQFREATPEFRMP